MDCTFQQRPCGHWQCQRCGWIYPLHADAPPRRNCPKSVDVRQAAERLGWKLSDALHYARALAAWTVAGFPRRTQAEVGRLWAVCLLCEKHTNGRCAACGCRVNRHWMPLTNKLAMGTEACPLDKWQ